jgi:acetyl esterase/lipase
MRYLTRFLLLPFLLASCATSAPKFPNTYTVERTFNKTVEKFPFIRIASTEVPATVVEQKNLTYIRDGKRVLQLDLYRPRNPHGKRPAVVLVHGGGWRSGYRTHLTPLAIELAKAGYVAATISYRLAPEAHYPAAIHDVKAAVRWMRANADRYGVNPDRIAVGGSSAGGQIASLVGVTNGMDKFDPQAADTNISSAVQLILNIDGLSDFTSEEARKYEDDPRKSPSSAGSWFGGRYAEKKALWHEASPTFYVSDSTPPILFLNSARERFHVGRDEMIKKMEARNIPYRVETLPNTPHTFWLFDPWLKPAATIVVEFLEEHFQR